jgi:GTP:adenosylcobinamide-phosphate guanylyltransferase
MKDQIQNYFDDLFDAVAEGDKSALVAFAEIASVQKMISEIAEAIKEYAMKEADAYDDATFTESGYKFTKVPARRMVDYSGVPQWADLKKRQQEIESLALTAASTFGVAIFDEKTGEQIPPAAIKYSKPGLSVKV